MSKDVLNAGDIIILQKIVRNEICHKCARNRKAATVYGDKEKMCKLYV